MTGQTRNAYSVYHAGTVSVRKPFAQHYSILANYTYSKSIDVTTDIQLTDTPMDYLHPNLDRAVGDNDVRHRLVLTLLGESPNTWNHVLRNFKVSMLNTLQTPRYYTVLAGFDVNGDQYHFPTGSATSDEIPIEAIRRTPRTCGCKEYSA